MKNGKLHREGEELIIKSLGYLKPPESFRRKFDIKNSEHPVAFSQEKDGKVRLIFEWNQKDIIINGVE